MKKTSLTFIVLLILSFLLSPGEAVQGASYTTFADVPANHWAWQWIESLYQAGITGGCSTDPLVYCPEQEVTRAQMAVFLERGMNGSTFNPPPATGTVFNDVLLSHWAAKWIEKLNADGITAGCGGGNYCPEDSVKRSEMAIFLLRAKYGASYTPPPASGTMFNDVPAGAFAAAWIERLAVEGITGGCGSGIYCPDAPVTRAQMAVFLVRTFNLPLVSQPPGPAFPRLGMFWPRPDRQPHADIARYDWVVLANAAGIYIDELRQINPTMFILNSTDAHEISYSPYDPAIQQIPYQWYLTQVGTTLRSSVNATQTVLPVNAVTLSSGGKTYELFVPGDTALIEGESVYVQSVNAADRTLTVQRGFIRPASSHAAGTRIAAHITFWENSWILNVSTLSPLGVADPLYGPERWTDYHARNTAAMLDGLDWDGILIDGANPTQSSLLYISNARTIDPDQSNTLLTDYSAFDAAWTEGMTHYLQQLRNAVGPDPIIYQNQGTPAFDIVNGSNFEAFPQDTGDSHVSGWHTTVFGPLHTTKSYFEWLDNALQPNLTMVETYEDDYGIIDSYNNPCNDPGFTPDYQKMRFGLTTALLGDGYYSYEMSTNGHGSLCLMWFDEYDNAGAGRGYLGYPLAPAYQVFAPPSTPNLAAGGGFNSSTDLAAWNLWPTNSNYAATITRDTTQFIEGVSSARVTVTKTAGEEWGISLFSSPVNVAAGSEYTLTFWAKADQERHISAWVQQTTSPWQKTIVFDRISLTTGWTQYQLSGVAGFASANLKLIFALSETTGTIWLDDVRLQLGGVDVWRRDFDNGIALVNATSQPVTIPLGGTFRKINGTQVPSINNGSLVTSVTLQPLDGIILLRP